MLPPTEYHRAMAARRIAGAQFLAIAREFQTTVSVVQGAIRRVEQYERGMQILQENPGSLEGLELIGKVRPIVRHTLGARGYRTLHDLDNVSPADLIRMPNIGRHSAVLLIELAAAAMRSAAADPSRE
jgi:hypothetical protein